MGNYSTHRAPENGRATTYQPPVRSGAKSLLVRLLTSSLIHAEDWDELADESRAAIQGCCDQSLVLGMLVERGLLTQYQASRVMAGKWFGLVLGNYRILDHLGVGGMGVVFKAEHLRLRRPVAIKVLSAPRSQPSKLLRRFYTEMRAIAQLQHPNIVGAIDAGETSDPQGDGPILHYLVMEYVPGQNLEEYVLDHGPLHLSQACDLIHQVAGALELAHRHSLVHRDVKPSNIIVTPDGRAKLLDFGLARHFSCRLTEPGTVLGSIDYMAPEQVRDAASVDVRADIYSLGGTLFWCLTGGTPFPAKEDFVQELNCRLTQEPPSARASLPHLPLELDAIIARMMARVPEERFSSPQEVMTALVPLLKRDSRQVAVGEVTARPAPSPHPIPQVASEAHAHRILVVDDEDFMRQFCRCALEEEGLHCTEAENGVKALEWIAREPCDLIVLDWSMPEMCGLDVCRSLRKTPPCPNLKVILISAHGALDDVKEVLAAGADDYLMKPFSPTQLVARVKAALRLKDAQDRTDVLNRHLLAINGELERTVGARDSDLIHARNALVLALAKLVEYRDSETGAHLLRLQKYARCLGEEAAASPTFSSRIDASFIQMLECCAPLHDIGKVGLPDHILLKPGRLDADERIIMQAHTVIGADTLKAVLQQHGSAVAFLQTAHDIARHHHERYDGKGYPDRLEGEAIPLVARFVSVCDVYDALRSRRVYKPALSHSATIQLIMEDSPGQFDPALLRIFEKCSSQFEKIFDEQAS
jgi:response regulator RpfG family c-di-GMP phosphodiesterase